MIRAFLAIQLSESLRATLAAIQSDVRRGISQELPRDASVSWVRPAAFHLTVKFLSDIDEGLVTPLRDAIADALSGHRVIEIPLDHLGAFPNRQQPRVLWMGPFEQWEKSEDAARLAALHSSVEACCESLNLAPETRPLSAHLTLARVKSGHRAVGRALAKSGAMDRPLDAGSLSVDAIVLMRSELNPRGSIYTVLWESKLQTA